MLRKRTGAVRVGTERQSSEPEGPDIPRRTFGPDGASGADRAEARGREADRGPVRVRGRHAGGPGQRSDDPADPDNDRSCRDRNLLRRPGSPRGKSAGRGRPGVRTRSGEHERRNPCRNGRPPPSSTSANPRRQRPAWPRMPACRPMEARNMTWNGNLAKPDRIGSRRLRPASSPALSPGMCRRCRDRSEGPVPKSRKAPLQGRSGRRRGVTTPFTRTGDAPRRGRRCDPRRPGMQPCRPSFGAA